MIKYTHFLNKKQKKVRISSDCFFFRPNGFKTFRFHHFVLLNKENKKVEITPFND